MGASHTFYITNISWQIVNISIDQDHLKQNIHMPIDVPWLQYQANIITTWFTETDRVLV